MINCSCRIGRLFVCKILGKVFQYAREILDLDVLSNIFSYRFALLVIRKK